MTGLKISGIRLRMGSGRRLYQKAWDCIIQNCPMYPTMRMIPHIASGLSTRSFPALLLAKYAPLCFVAVVDISIVGQAIR